MPGTVQYCTTKVYHPNRGRERSIGTSLIYISTTAEMATQYTTPTMIKMYKWKNNSTKADATVLLEQFEVQNQSVPSKSRQDWYRIQCGKFDLLKKTNIKATTIKCWTEIISQRGGAIKFYQTSEASLLSSWITRSTIELSQQIHQNKKSSKTPGSYVLDSAWYQLSERQNSAGTASEN